MKLVQGNNFMMKCPNCGKDIIAELAPYCSRTCKKQFEGY
jgi:endogenous inhibitor of DNA gyrase (YacG/DUF329 family)